MKANEAPEKIYFNRESIESIPDDDPLFNYLPIKENDDDIEYIRTDVFIEKLEKFLNQKDDRDSYTIGYIKKHLKEIIKEAGI